MIRYLLLFLIGISGQTFANPTVTIAPLAGVQDNPTSNSILYFSVTFSESVAGFTESDVVLSGTAQANNVYIKLMSCLIPDQNFVIAVNGMSSSGTVVVNIPAEVAASNNEGTGNLQSNTVEIVYQLPFEACSILAGNVFNSIATFYYPAVGYNPTNSCKSEPGCYSVFNGGIYGQYKALRYVNNTGSTLCLNVAVSQEGATCYPFHIYKDELPVVDDFSYIERWIGGSAGITYEDVSPSTRNGFTYRYAHAQIADGQTFYVVVRTANEDFYVTTNLNCSALNFLSSTENEMLPTITISPNPSEGVFSITSNQPVDKVIVYNLLGQKVYEGNNAQIDISNQSEGVYSVEIIAQNLRTYQKIIKN